MAGLERDEGSEEDEEKGQTLEGDGCGIHREESWR